MGTNETMNLAALQKQRNENGQRRKKQIALRNKERKMLDKRDDSTTTVFAWNGSREMYNAMLPMSNCRPRFTSYNKRNGKLTLTFDAPIGEVHVKLMQEVVRSGEGHIVVRADSEVPFSIIVREQIL